MKRTTAHLVILTTLATSLALGGGAQASSNGRPLMAVAGQGAGRVNLALTSAKDGFSAQITVNVHGAAPNTTFYITRAPEVGRPLANDGICQRAAGEWPWEQPNSIGFPAAPAFVPFPRPLAGDLKTLVTGPGGTGATHYAFDLPILADGTEFDVVVRLVDSLTTVATDLRTACFTVTVK